jgi:hypothetical protein
MARTCCGFRARLAPTIRPTFHGRIAQARQLRRGRRRKTLCRHQQHVVALEQGRNTPTETGPATNDLLIVKAGKDSARFHRTDMVERCRQFHSRKHLTSARHSMGSQALGSAGDARPTHPRSVATCRE